MNWNLVLFIVWAICIVGLTVLAFCSNKRILMFSDRQKKNGDKSEEEPVANDMEHERLQWQSMTERQLEVRLSKITDRRKLSNFIEMAVYYRQNGHSWARDLETKARERMAYLIVQQRTRPSPPPNPPAPRSRSGETATVPFPYRTLSTIHPGWQEQSTPAMKPAPAPAAVPPKPKIRIVRIFKKEKRDDT